jgi:hypothetical protein
VKEITGCGGNSKARKRQQQCETPFPAQGQLRSSHFWMKGAFCFGVHTSDAANDAVQ